MLLPHLSDDELFEMEHILDDRSKEPIKKYFFAIIERDRQRAVTWFDSKPPFPEKASEAVWDTIHLLREFLPNETILRLSRTCDTSNIWAKIDAYERLATTWHDETSRTLLVERVLQDRHGAPSSIALKVLAKRWSVVGTRKLFQEHAVQDQSADSRHTALGILAEKWRDETTRKLLQERAVKDHDWLPRCTALELLASWWADETTRKLLQERAVKDESYDTRIAAFRALAEKWPDQNTRKLLQTGATDASFNEATRGECLVLLGKMHSEFGRILFTIDLSGYKPYIDIRNPISVDRIEQTARRANVPVDKIDETVRSLLAHLGWDITKGVRE